MQVILDKEYPIFSSLYSMCFMFVNEMFDITAMKSARVEAKKRAEKNIRTLFDFAKNQNVLLPEDFDNFLKKLDYNLSKNTDDKTNKLYRIINLSFIKYILEFDAPSKELIDSFAHHKNSIKQENIPEIKIELTEDVVFIFDGFFTPFPERRNFKKNINIKNSKKGVINSIKNRADSVLKRIGLLVILINICFFIMLLFMYVDGSYMYRRETFDYMICSFIGFIIGLLLYLGFIDKLFKWIKTGE